MSITIHNVDYTNPNLERWLPEPIPELTLTEEQYETFLRGYSPDWECRYAPYFYEGWFYITRSGFWIKKFRFNKRRDGIYHLAEHYTTQVEPSRNLLSEILIEGYFKPSLKELGILYLQNISAIHKTNIIIEITDSNYKDYCSLNIAAFSYAHPGAMGEGGSVIIIDKQGMIYHTNYCESIEYSHLMNIVPVLKECEIQTFILQAPNGWKSVSLGAGNMMAIRTEYYDQFEKEVQFRQIERPGILFQQWSVIVLKILGKGNEHLTMNNIWDELYKNNL